MIKALIVDDEKAPREVLQEILKDFCPQVEIVGLAKDTFEAEKMIAETSPDLLFLDVEMPRRSGIEFLREQENISYDVIFTTAFEHYAIDAIKLAALDYLVKPIDIKELVQAVHRVAEENGRAERIQTFLSNGNSPINQQRVALHQADGVDFVPIGNIIYCQAEGSYTQFHLKEGKSVLVSKSLKHYEDMLKGYQFYRCHKSYLVNLHAIQRFNKEGYLDLNNGDRVMTSRKKKDEIISLISGK